MVSDSRLEKRRNALARMSGVIEHLAEHDDEVSTEYLMNRFNNTLEDCDIESEVLKISVDN